MKFMWGEIVIEMLLFTAIVLRKWWTLKGEIVSAICD
jgi:hypothetical protein